MTAEKNKADNPKQFFGTLTGIVLIFYVLTSVTDQQLFRIPIQILSFSVVIPVRLFDLMIVLVSVLTGVGVYSVLGQTFPMTLTEKWLHAFLPLASAAIIGVSLKNSGGGMAWWLVLFFGGMLLWAVLQAEYFVCDRNSVWNPVAVILLTSLSGAIFLLGAIAVRTNVLRLILELPLVFFIAFSSSLSLFSLWLRDENIRLHSAAAAAVITLAAMGLHYIPLNAVSYGILLFIWYYIFINVEIRMASGKTMAEAVKPQLLMLAALVIVFIFAVK